MDHTSDQTSMPDNEIKLLGSAIELKRVDVIKIYQLESKTFAISGAALLLAGLVAYGLYVPYVGKSTVLIHDSQNSSLQAFTQQFFGMAKTIQETKKGNSVLTKYTEYLKTREYLETLVDVIQKRGSGTEISIDEAAGFAELQSVLGLEKSETLKKDFKTLQKLSSLIKIKVDSDFELKIQAVTPSKVLSLFLTNSASTAAIAYLQEKESMDMDKMESFLSEQQKVTNGRIQKLSEELATLQSKGGAVPVVAKDKMGDYMAELVIRANELKLKISENQRIIQSLQGGPSIGKTSQLYGTGGRIETFRVENSIAQARLKEIESKVAQLRTQTKEMPLAALQMDDVKRKLDLEFANYKELSDVAAKLQVRKMSVQSKFDLIESARAENVAAKFSLMTILGLSFFVSQVIAAALVYLKLSRYSFEEADSSSRDVDGFDTGHGHQFDPRFMFEDSKIRFSLNSRKDDSDTPSAIGQSNNPKES